MPFSLEIVLSTHQTCSYLFLPVTRSKIAHGGGQWDESVCLYLLGPIWFLFLRGVPASRVRDRSGGYPTADGAAGGLHRMASDMGIRRLLGLEGTIALREFFLSAGSQ